jgi:hypothetical protein
MAAPTDNQVLEKAVGGLPLVATQGLNTNKAANFSGTQIDTSGNISSSGYVTGPTGSFTVVNVTTAEVTGATGTTATIGLTGAAAGGPTTAAQDGWMKMTISGTQVWVPVWK